MQATEEVPNNNQLVPAEEDDSYLPYNTPMQELRNLLDPLGIRANYNVETVGPHYSNFKCCVSFKMHRSYFSSNGLGRTNYQAKISAASGLLESLKAILGGMYGMDTPLDGYEESKAYGNPVGLLQEICNKRHWDAPKYQVVSVAGPQHSLVFNMVCIVQNCQSEGVGQNKKRSKRMAAQAMLNILLQNDYGQQIAMKPVANPNAYGQYVADYHQVYNYAAYHHGGYMAQ